METSPKGNNSSEDVSQNHNKKFIRSRTRKQNLPSAGEHSSENKPVPSGRPAKPLSLSSVGTTKSSPQNPEKINQHDATSSTGTFISSRELRSRAKCSRSADAILSPRQKLRASSSRVLQDSNDSGINIQRDRSSLRGKRNTRFAPPPERVAVRVTRSNLKISKETVSASIPTKRIKKPPESDSGKSETKNETYGSKLRPSAAAATLHKSRINAQTQEMRASPRKDETSESFTKLSLPSKRRRKITKSSSGESKIANDSCNLQSPSSAVNIVQEPPTTSLTQESKVDFRNVEESDSDIEGKTLISLQDHLPSDLHSPVKHSDRDDLHSPVKHSDRDDLHLTGSFLNLPADEYESPLHSNVSTDASSASPNLEPGKQKDTQSALDVSDPDVLPNLPSTELLTDLHPTALSDAYLFSTNNDAGKRKERLSPSHVLSEVVQPDLPTKGAESAVHPLAHNESPLNLGQTSKPRNSTTDNYESCIKIRETQASSPVSSRETQASSPVSSRETQASPVSSKETQSVSKAADLVMKKQKLKSPQSRRIILNPHLSSSSIVVDSGIETRGLKPFQTNPKYLNPHLRSSCHSSRPIDSVINSPSRILETSDERAKIYQNQPHSSVQTSPSNAESRYDLMESSTSRSPGMLRSYVSDETLTSKNLPDIRARRNLSNSFKMTQSRETSRNFPEIAKDSTRRNSVDKPQFRRMLSSSVSNTSLSGNPKEFSTQSGRSNKLVGTTENFPSNKSSTARNNLEVQTQRNSNEPLLQRRRSKSISDDASTSRNLSTVGSGINPPYINVSEGEASTSQHRPLMTDGSSSFDHPDSMTRNRPLVGREINSPYIERSEENSRKSSAQPFTTTSDDKLDSNVSQGGEAPERLHGTIAACTDWLPLYLSEARVLLQNVMRDMLLYVEDYDTWRKFAALFLRVSKSSFIGDRMNLYLDLMSYSVLRAKRLWIQNISEPPGMTTETYLKESFEKLLSIVITTLASILSVRSRSDFDGLILNHQYFKNFNDIFSRYWENNIENLEHDPSGNHSNLKKMIRRLLVVVLSAFEFILRYVGENAEDQPEQLVINPQRTEKENLPSDGGHPSENQHSPSSKSIETSSRPCTPISPSSPRAPVDINELGATSSIANIFSSSLELRSSTNCSRTVDALISPRQHSAIPSMPILDNSYAAGVKTGRRFQSSLEESRNTDFASRPERGPFQMPTSFPAEYFKTSTLSPEKWSVETNAASTPSKRSTTASFSEIPKQERIDQNGSSKDLRSENRRSPSSRSTETYSRPSIPICPSSLRAPDGISALGATSFIAGIFLSSLRLLGLTNCSRTVDALISPRQHLAVSTTPVLDHSDATRVKTYLRFQSSFGENLNSDFSARPEHGPFQVPRSFPTEYFKTSTPSPEKRSVETNAASTPSKRSTAASFSEIPKQERIDQNGSSRNLPATTSEMNPLYIDVFEGEASTSRHQPLVTDSSYAYDQASSLDVLYCEKPPPEYFRNIEQSLPCQPDSFPMYAVQARLLLQSVLEELMRCNEEDRCWSLFADLFLRFFKTSSEIDRANLNAGLMLYFAHKGYNLLRNIAVRPDDRTPETYITETYGMLTSLVVATVSLTLTRSNSDFDSLIAYYESFRSLYDAFSIYWKTHNIDHVKYETSRFHLKIWKERIQRLLLVTLTAFQLLLIYIGENSEERTIRIYEEKLSEGDKKYLRRNR